jgi:hypothetical protein
MVQRQSRQQTKQSENVRTHLSLSVSLSIPLSIDTLARANRSTSRQIPRHFTRSSMARPGSLLIACALAAVVALSAGSFVLSFVGVPPPARARGGNALFRRRTGDDHSTTGGNHRRRDLCRGLHLVLFRLVGCQCRWLLRTLEQVRGVQGRIVWGSMPAGISSAQMQCLRASF